MVHYTHITVSDDREQVGVVRVSAESWRVVQASGDILRANTSRELRSEIWTVRPE